MSARSGQLRGRRHVTQTRHIGTPRLVISIIVCVVFAAGTGAGATRTGALIAAGAQRFLTFYSGVFALVALTAAVAAGLIATDRIIMSAEGRIVAQAVHRALTFVSVAFLATHILTEILVGRSQVIDSVVPFLAHGRTFYIGIGTIGSDLMVLIAATGIARRRFAGGTKPLTWKLLHGTAYAAWPLSIVHGLVAGRPPKPYVSWSYGACLIAVGLALVIRSVVTVRPRQESARAWAGDEESPLHAAATAAQAYLLQVQQAQQAQLAPLAAVRAGLLAAAPAGLPAGVASGALAGQTAQWPGRGTPPYGFPAQSLIQANVAHTPGHGIPAQTPAHGLPAQTPAHGIPAQTPPHGIPAQTPAHGLPAQTPAHGIPAQTPPHGIPAQTPAHGIPVQTPLVRAPSAAAHGDAAYGAAAFGDSAYSDPAYGDPAYGQCAQAPPPHTSPAHAAPHTLSPHTPPDGYPAPLPPHGMRAHTPTEWTRNLTPAEGMPAAPAQASLPYQVQALQPTPRQDRQPGWGAP